MSLPPEVRDWQAAGRLVVTPVGSVFVRSQQGERPTLLLLHGFPSSSYDFRDVTRLLGDRAWLTLDFLGFGLSDKPRPHRYSLFEQADIVERVVAESVAGPVVLIAHDMGTSVATELLARDLEAGCPSICSVRCSPTAASSSSGPACAPARGSCAAPSDR